MSDSDSIPDVYDPYGELNPNYDDLYYDPDSESFYVPNQESPVEVPDNILQSINGYLENDPTDESKMAVKTLRSELERLMEDKLPQEADEALPKQIFTLKEAGIIYFHDSSFAGPTLRSFQGVTKNVELRGFAIIKACDVSRIRSRVANHNRVTTMLYVPPEILEGIGAFFE